MSLPVWARGGVVVSAPGVSGSDEVERIKVITATKKEVRGSDTEFCF